MYVALKMVLVSRTGNIYTRGEIISEELTENEVNVLTHEGAIKKQDEVSTAAEKPAVFVCDKPADDVVDELEDKPDTPDEITDDADMMIDAASAITPSVPKRRSRRKE